jgi:hypothetical protein
MTGTLQSVKINPPKGDYKESASLEISTCSDKIFVMSGEVPAVRGIAPGVEVEYELSEKQTKNGTPILKSIRALSGGASTSNSSSDSKDISIYTSYAKDIYIAGKAKDANDAVDTVFAMRDRVAERLNDPF